MTADPATLTALAARCEAAEGPSRELDEAIVQGVYPELDIRRDGPDGLWRAYGSTMGRDCILRVEDYTASLDAALTLVPARAMWAAGVDEDGMGCADMPQHRMLVHARTPALALCAAALRALAEGRE